jgi:exosortase
MRLALAAALAVGVAWLYGDLARGLLHQWAASPDASYGAILAVVAGVLFWQRRHQIGAPGPRSALSYAGLALVCAGLAAYLVGLFAADLFTSRASFVVLAAGAIWFLGGEGPVRAAATPLAFLLLAIPLPELVVTSLTSSLQTVAARIAETTLTLAGTPVYREGNVLALPGTTLQIAQACSGLRSVVSLASVGILLAWATPGSALGRAALVLATIPIAVFVNGLRVAATGAAAEAWGPAMTRDPWHTIAGWVTFVVSLALLWAVRRGVERDDAPHASPQVAHA